MLYQASLQLQTRCLGDIAPPDDNSVRRFHRSACHRWQFSDRVWRCLTSEAVRALRLDDVITNLAFCLPQPIEMPVLCCLTRPTKRGDRKIDILHECIEEGSVLTLEFHVSDTESFHTMHRRFFEGDKLRAVTEDDVREVLVYIGRNLGISPWGWGSGYGRFVLLDLKQQ